MYLKSIELQGFKSFPDRTKLIFDPGHSSSQMRVVDDANAGVTVIVGPNGSGKSNIADAMRWVLGEISSKTLRGSKMEDVIFGGADSRRPMGYAEVSLVIDNTTRMLEMDNDEVRVTRRCYRSGGSEYQLNGATVRLEDIEACPELKILSTSPVAGLYACATDRGRQIFITGHSEYDAGTLRAEYLRDKNAGLPIELPVNYFPNDDDTQEPIVTWRSCANLLYSNWLNYFVYQTTPYDREQIN